MSDSDEKRNIVAIGMVVALAMQFAAIIWGAATMAASLRSLETTVHEVQNAVVLNQQEAARNHLDVELLKEFRKQAEQHMQRSPNQ